MPILLLLLTLFPANVTAGGAPIDCKEIREVLVEAVDEGYYKWRDVDRIYRRCVQANERLQSYDYR